MKIKTKETDTNEVRDKRNKFKKMGNIEKREEQVINTMIKKKEEE